MIWADPVILSLQAHMHYQQFFDFLWQRYIQMTPQAEEIKNLFMSRGERVVNDHIAFRTFKSDKLGMAVLEPHFFAMGYRKLADYHFASKHLDARAYIHATDAEAPKIFLSELLLDELSIEAQAIIQVLLSPLSANHAEEVSLFWSGRPWANISYADYQLLAAESEYAGWLAVHGFCANHFTVDVNALAGFDGIEPVLAFVKQAGFALNAVGGELKGVPADLLVQGSTLADKLPVEFADGNQHSVPSCFYEFAERFAEQSEQAGGKLFQGFLAANADKIFESTNR